MHEYENILPTKLKETSHILCVSAAVTAALSVFMQDSSYWVPYIAAGLIILFILFFCGGPGMCFTQLSFTHITISSSHKQMIVLCLAGIIK